jgi:hypothetical protein
VIASITGIKSVPPCTFLGSLICVTRA